MEWDECVDKHVCLVLLVVMNENEKNERNHELKTFEHISENEGRECASETMHACERFKYDCGQSDPMLGRSPSSKIRLNNSDGLEKPTS